MKKIYIIDTTTRDKIIGIIFTIIISIIFGFSLYYSIITKFKVIDSIEVLFFSGIFLTISIISNFSKTPPEEKDKIIIEDNYLIFKFYKYGKLKEEITINIKELKDIRVKKEKKTVKVRGGDYTKITIIAYYFHFKYASSKRVESEIMDKYFTDIYNDILQINPEVKLQLPGKYILG